jgi:hypothetical protein
VPDENNIQRFDESELVPLAATDVRQVDDDSTRKERGR